MKSNERILIVASAGGHLTQAMCMASLFDDIVLVSNKQFLGSERISSFHKIWDTQHNPLIHLFNVGHAAYILLTERPAAILSTGGPIALPFALVAKIFGYRFVWVDTLSRVVELSNTGRIILRYKLYDVFISQWEEVAKAHGVEYHGKAFDILGENTARQG